MIKPGTPEIEVGIMKAEKIRVRLDGKFQLLPDGKKLEGNAVAEIVNGRVSLKCGDEDFVSAEPLRLQPLNEGQGRFTLRDVVIGIGFHWDDFDLIEDGEFKPLFFSGFEFFRM